MNARQHQCGNECNIVINLFATSNTDKHTHKQNTNNMQTPELFLYHNMQV